MKYLFLLTITPVQDFISQSRKLKDLYGSSSILSNMSKTGIEYAKTKGATVIFPQSCGNHNSYPNRFLVEIELENEEAISEFAKELENKILEYFYSLNNTKSEIVKRHIENFFSIYWSASEYSGEYKEAFYEVEKRLAGAKNTRFFTQLGEVGRKCSICGERNVAIYKKPMRFYIEKQRKSLIEAKKQDNFQNGEGLCGICYLKRISASKSFDSTADIAIMNIPKGIRGEFKNLSKDSQLFYEENITKDFFDKNDVGLSLEECLKEYKEFKKAIKDYKQTSYYAVIMFDGDDMGEWLSGKRLKDKIELKVFHENISKNLASFAQKAQNILKEPKGITVYAGGEDFLGFVNINNLFEVLEQLNKEYNKVVSEPLRNKYSLRKDFTFSAGIVIAHYKTPLGTVLNEVRKSEKKAKNNSGKDSVCITVMKRSGEIRESILKHKHIPKLSRIIKELKNNFSDSFISVLEEEFLLMVAKDGRLDSNIRKSMIMDEVQRLLNRSKKEENVNVENIKKFIDGIFGVEFKNFSDALSIAKFVNREIQ